MDLQPGDIVLYPVTPRSELLSKLVAIGEMLLGAGKSNDSYSHAAVWESDGWEYEAKWPRTGYYRIDHRRPIEVWRIEGMTQDQRKKIIHWCATHCGEWYNLIGLLTFGLIGFHRTAVCSQFVGRAYAAAGVHIGLEGKRLLSPNAIADFKRAHMVYSFSGTGK